MSKISDNVIAINEQGAKVCLWKERGKFGWVIYNRNGFPCKQRYPYKTKTKEQTKEIALKKFVLWSNSEIKEV